MSTGCNHYTVKCQWNKYAPSYKVASKHIASLDIHVGSKIKLRFNTAYPLPEILSEYKKSLAGYSMYSLCTCTITCIVNTWLYVKLYYYTSDSRWKIWLVESIQSIHNSLWTWHDKCNICCRYCIYHVKFNVAWLLSRLECSPQKQNGWTLRFCFWGWIMWKMYNKTIIEFGFRMIS